jgi:hypothetical protein
MSRTCCAVEKRGTSQGGQRKSRGCVTQRPLRHGNAPHTPPPSLSVLAPIRSVYLSSARTVFSRSVTARSMSSIWAIKGATFASATGRSTGRARNTLPFKQVPAPSKPGSSTTVEAVLTQHQHRRHHGERICTTTDVRVSTRAALNSPTAFRLAAEAAVCSANDVFRPSRNRSSSTVAATQG